MKLYEQVHKPKYKHIKSSELAWVGDFNPKMLSMFESMGARVVKTHYTYEWTSPPAPLLEERGVIST